MPVYLLSESIAFPPPDLARPDGILAVGGDLSVDRLLMAYRMGIFPWYGDGDPIIWWSPDPRLVLYPSALRVSRRLARTARQNRFEITFDRAFDAVIDACARIPRKRDDGTWIVPDMVRAYNRLHRAGYAHSVEAWQDGELVGGLYGVSLGGSFFGESMFTHERDASKVAFVRLVSRLNEWGFDLVDCQVRTEHLIRFGAGEIPRKRFLTELRRSVARPTRAGAWIRN
jgi:leucyl/phenylalanyl-tRNA---protein transferase